MSKRHLSLSPGNPKKESSQKLHLGQTAVEAMLWHYAFGKPRDSLDVTVGSAGDLSELSAEDLLHRVDWLREQVREQAASERALPGEYRSA